jgi:uncharacterized membrane protein
MAYLCFGRVGRSTSQIFCPACFFLMGIPVLLPVVSKLDDEDYSNFLLVMNISVIPWLLLE